jgi:hypothetical protein
MLGEFDEGQALLHDSLVLSRRSGHAKGESESLFGLGWAALRRGEHAAAGALFRESLSIARRLGENKDIADALVSLSVVAGKQNDASEARALAEEGCHCTGRSAITAGFLTP